jgi:tetratricopeptide (TPR) repeat protein
MVIGDDEQKQSTGIRSLLPGTRHKIAAGVSLAILVLVGIGLAYYFSATHTPKSTSANNTGQEKADQAVSKTVEHPDYAASAAYLKSQLANTRDHKKQADIYVGLASLAQQQGKYQEVIDNQLLAVQADPSRSELLALTTANAYAKLGNKTEALKYYQQALTYYRSKPENFSGRTYYINSVQAKIAELRK